MDFLFFSFCLFINLLWRFFWYFAHYISFINCLLVCRAAFAWILQLFSQTLIDLFILKLIVSSFLLMTIKIDQHLFAFFFIFFTMMCLFNRHNTHNTAIFNLLSSNSNMESIWFVVGGVESFSFFFLLCFNIYSSH